MAKKAKLKSVSLSMRLLREGRTIESAFRDDHELQEVGASEGRLYVGQAPSTPPTWFAFVEEFSQDPLKRLSNQSCSAILFLNLKGVAASKGRIMVLCFGTGHHALNPDAFERNFGLRVVLNTVDRANLRSVDTATLDSTTFQRRTQASRDSDLQNFGVEINRDLLRLAAGTPRDKSFAKGVAGRDALIIHTKVSASDVSKKCEHVLQLFSEKTYEKDFKWVDYIVPVRAYDLKIILDEIAFAEIKTIVEAGDSDLHLSLPEMFDPESATEVGYFGLGLKPGAKETFLDIAIEDYTSQLQGGRFNDIPNMESIKSSHELRVVQDGEGDKKQKRRVYDCLVFEAEYNGKLYVLFAGEWYCVDKAFYESVENHFETFLSQNPLVKMTKSRNEKEFIKELDKTRPDLLNLDITKVSPRNMPGANFEPCDFLSKTKQLIHLKDGHDSGSIGHLWNQGMVSAESFVRDADYRKGFRDVAIKRQKKTKKKGFEVLLPDMRTKLIPSEFSVVYGIMRVPYARTKTLGLPFFSKVSLRSATDRITMMGFNVEVHLIEKPRNQKKKNVI